MSMFTKPFTGGLTDYAIKPAMLGGVLGAGYGAYDTTTNPYARDSIGSYAMKGAISGMAIGGLGASVGRGVRDYKIYKASKYGNNYGLSGFNSVVSGL